MLGVGYCITILDIEEREGWKLNIAMEHWIWKWTNNYLWVATNKIMEQVVVPKLCGTGSVARSQRMYAASWMLGLVLTNTARYFGICVSCECFSNPAVTNQHS